LNWACVGAFTGPSIGEVIELLRRLQSDMDSRYDELLTAGRRKITRGSGGPAILVVIDELAHFSATVATPSNRRSSSA